MKSANYPVMRLRRNRQFSWLRELVAENTLLPSDLIWPVFIIEGNNNSQEIISMPGVSRLTIDLLVKEVEYARQLGIRAVALFPCVNESLKTEDAREALNPNNLICRAVRAIKQAELDIGVICDVALDPYTTHSHDGIMLGGVIDNDATLIILCQQAIVLAKSGADVIAPSDMMDGRVQAIRAALDLNNFINVNILSYAAKYASNFYSPFRDAVGSAKDRVKLDKSTYQMDIRNIKEALREIEQDIAEGADFIMIKPGLLCQDVIYAAAANFNIPIFAYQVSGEYAMIKLAAQNGILNFENCLLESLVSLKRAGAKNILTYGAVEAAKFIRQNYE